MATKLQEIQACPQICDYELYLNYVYEEKHKATGYRATATFKSLSIFFGLLVGNLGLDYKATLNSNMYANMRLCALPELCWRGKPQSYIKIEETSIWYVCYKCDYYT